MRRRISDVVLLLGMAYLVVLLLGPFVYYAIGCHKPCPPCYTPIENDECRALACDCCSGSCCPPGTGCTNGCCCEPWLGETGCMRPDGTCTCCSPGYSCSHGCCCPPGTTDCCGDDDGGGGCGGGCCSPCCDDECGCPSPGDPGFGGGGIGVGVGISGPYRGTFTASSSGHSRGLPVAGDPVYIRDGEFKHSMTDISIPGRNMSINITRSYRSQLHMLSTFGYGWTFNYDIRAIRIFDGETLVAVFLYDGTVNSYKYTKDDYNPDRFVRTQSPGTYFLKDSNSILTLYRKNGQKYVFDSSDKISVIEDRYGNKLMFEYGSGRLSRVADDANHYVTFTYNTNDFINTLADSAGRTWTYQYDPDTNDLLYVTGPNTPEYPDGLTTSYWYEDSNLVDIYDANDDLFVHNYYSIDGKIIQQDVGEGSYYFDYNDVQNKTTTITDREGIRIEMVYDGDTGQLASHTIFTEDANAVPNSFTTSYYYDPLTKHRTRIVYPGGNCEDFTYDARGNITGKYKKTGTDKPNDPCDPNVMATIYSFDANWPDEVSSITDAMGNVTYFDYNGTTGNIEQIRHPDGSSEQFTYNTYGQVESRTAPDGIVTKYVYYNDANDANNYGRLWRTIEDYNIPDGCNITTEFKYDALGRIVEVKDPNGDVTQSKYNNLDQLIESITPSPYNYVTKLSYDAKGNKSKIEREIGGENDPNQVMAYLYNEQNKLAEITDPLGYVTKYGYNRNDEPNGVTDAEDNTTLTEYNERGLVAKVTDANGGIICFSYTANGDLNDINDPNGNITRFEYDGFSRLVKIIYPDDSNEQFGYDKNGNVTSKTTRNGDTITYQYDSMNRMTAKSRPNEPNTIFTYDIAGRLADVSDGRDVNDGGGITRYKYDRLSRITEVNDIYGRIVAYEYDNKGLRTRLDYPDTAYDVNYTYDALGRISDIYRYTYPAARYEYDELSRRTKVTYGNSANIIYEYDIGSRLTKLTNTLYGGSTLVYDYNSYDKVGNRLSMKVNDANAHVYDYDNLYQLTTVDYNDGNQTWYNYDKLGNRTLLSNGTQTGYESNRLNQYTKVADANYTYDKNGNLTFDGQYTYIYDCENRLTQVKQGETTIVSYAYDYQGRRVRKTHYASLTTQCFTYDGDQIIADYNEAGVWKRRYYYGPGIDEPICMVRTPGISSYVNYYHFDGLGSVVAMSNTSGQVIEKYSYDVFGQPTIRDINNSVVSVSSVANRYLFTGREFEPETENYYYRARFYKPGIGRFIQTDPIGNLPDGGIGNRFRPILRHINADALYKYVGNNPLNFIDPTGLGKDPFWMIPAPDKYKFKNWFHRWYKKKDGKPPCYDYSEDEMWDIYDEWLKMGKPSGPKPPKSWWGWLF